MWAGVRAGLPGDEADMLNLTWLLTRPLQAGLAWLQEA